MTRCDSPADSSNFRHERMSGSDGSGASAGADPTHRDTRPWGLPSMAVWAPRPKSAARRRRDTFPLDTRRPPDDAGVITPWSPCVPLFPFYSN